VALDGWIAARGGRAGRRGKNGEMKFAATIEYTRDAAKDRRGSASSTG